MSQSILDDVIRISATMDSAAGVIVGLAEAAGAGKAYQIALSGKASEASLKSISGALCALQKANAAIKVGLDFGEVAWHSSNFGWHFSDAVNLTSIVFPKIFYIENCALDNCANLETAVLQEGLESIGCQVFGNCGKLKSVQLPLSLKIVNDCAFMNCESLETVFYGGTKADWQRLALDNIDCCNEFLEGAKIVCCDGVFEAHKDLVVPESLGESVIEYEGYKNRSDVKTIEIRDGAIEIGKDAFYNCLNAQSAKIPASVRTIHDGAFPYCPKLKTVFFGGTQAQWKLLIESEGFERGNDALLKAKVICSDGEY